eukprot:535523_1
MWKRINPVLLKNQLKEQRNPKKKREKAHIVEYEDLAYAKRPMKRKREEGVRSQSPEKSPEKRQKLAHTETVNIDVHHLKLYAGLNTQIVGEMFDTSLMPYDLSVEKLTQIFADESKSSEEKIPPNMAMCFPEPQSKRAALLVCKQRLIFLYRGEFCGLVPKYAYLTQKYVNYLSELAGGPAILGGYFAGDEDSEFVIKDAIFSKWKQE